MVQIQESVKRCRGRPQIRCDDDTRRLIVEAAAKEFQAKGYAATCIGDVAQRAGVSTRTLYRLIPTKAALFKAVVTDRIGGFMLAIDEQVLGTLGLEAALERILAEFGRLTLSEETIAINRLVIGECERFPEIAAAFYEAAIQRVSDAMANWLRRQGEQGLIKLDDPQMAAGLLRGMMILDPQRAAMLGQRGAPGPDEIAQRAKICATLFLEGCRAASTRPSTTQDASAVSEAS
ncbi:MAG: TetR/AcrR family transcriptional regulator [Rhodomicrobium sp.]